MPSSSPPISFFDPVSFYGSQWLFDKRALTLASLSSPKARASPSSRLHHARLQILPIRREVINFNKEERPAIAFGGAG
jgi:hypothetical protein